MTGLIFLLTFLTVVVCIILIIIKKIRHKGAKGTTRVLLITVFGYTLLWVIFYFTHTIKTVAPGTDICFDDWCATISKTERTPVLENNNVQVKANGQFVIVHVIMSNHARGIAQRPSEPSIHIRDKEGHSWAYSPVAQQAYEKLFGKQLPLDARLELHQSLQTIMVFDIPAEAKNLEGLIEEGPFITYFIFKEDQYVFLIP